LFHDYIRISEEFYYFLGYLRNIMEDRGYARDFQNFLYLCRIIFEFLGVYSNFQDDLGVKRKLEDSLRFRRNSYNNSGW
jgi:hypothetical protein